MSRSEQPAFERPGSLGEATERLGESSWTILAGGTDLYPGLANQVTWAAATPQRVLDISGIDELAQIEETPDGYRIGSLVTWSQICAAELPRWFETLRLAALQVGGLQIQNRATVAGNLCNASPAADGVPALLALGAEVELTSHTGVRRLPLTTFITGNRRTARADDELVSALCIPHHRSSSRSSFMKLGARTHLVISIAMLAALLEADESGRIARARVAVGACSEVAQRLETLEARLTGSRWDADLGALVEEEDLASLSPIDDVRASAAYRSRAALVMLRRILRELSPGDGDQ